jgi:ABC-type multidrug transport system ATPase subunit
MSLQTCPSCRTPNVLIARFCDECGMALDASGARIVTIGSAPDNDVVLDYPIISGHHARLLIDGEQVTLEDLGSLNGTAVGRPEQKVSRQVLAPSDTVYFASLRVPASRLLDGRLALGSDPHSTLELKEQTLVAGRDPECGLVLDDPTISWHHARLVRAGGTVTLEDLGSTNGTFVNGRRIRGKVEVAVGDTVALGSVTFLLRSADRLERRDQRGNLTIEVRDLAIDVPGKRLVEGVSLTLYPGELVGLMGPSGAGKTTLMLAMNGYMPPGAGQVLFNGQDLYARYDQFRLHLGYVPQDDIMHGDLTVREALYYSARLRLPEDMRRAEIDERIRKVLAELGLEGTEDVLIGSPAKKGISGGQRKRVNLAMELLTDPSVLFLDEPTSGLSSEDALMVMKVLRQLADRGKTILVTIHQPSREVFRRMDNLVLLAKEAGSSDPGTLAYCGPAYPDSIHFFSPEDRSRPEPSPDKLLEGFGCRPAREWVDAYAASSYKRRYVDQRAGTGQHAAPTGEGLAHRPTSAGFLQWRTLLTRSLRIKARDLANTAILLLQAPVIAGLIVLVFGDQVSAEMTGANWQEGAGATATTIFLLAISALWFGCSNAAREIVAEWAVYHRERMINLGLPAYVGSKLAVLGAVSTLQCCALVAIVHRGCGLEVPWQPLLAVLVLTSLVGMALGLLISARARSSEVAISLVPLILLPMVILGGILQPPHKMRQPGGALTSLMASRWAFESMLVMESDERPESPSSQVPGQPPVAPVDVAERYFPKAERSAPATPVAVLLSMLGVLVAAILKVLKSRDVHR